MVEWLLSTKIKENPSSLGSMVFFLQCPMVHMKLFLRFVFEQRSKPLPMKIKLKPPKCNFYKTGDVGFPPQNFAEASNHQA